MLPKEERKALNEAFWAGFKTHMRACMSSSGRRINWINYPTGVKDVYMRMEVDAHGVRLCFDVQPKDDGIRSIIWEQMTELKTLMQAEMGIEAIYLEKSHYWNERLISRIKWEDNTLNYFNEEDIPKIIEFLKDKLITHKEFIKQMKKCDDDFEKMLKSVGICILLFISFYIKFLIF